MEVGQHVGDKGERVRVLDRDLIQLPIVLYKAKRAILLLDEEHRGSDWRLQQADSSVVGGIKISYEKCLQSLVLTTREML